MGAMAAGGAATSIIGQNTQRQMNKGVENQMKNAQDDLIMENRRRATHDYLRQVRLEQLSQTQEHDALATESADVAKQKDAATGQAVASAAERGVEGNSVATTISDFEFQQNREVGRLRLNQSMKDNQHTEAIAADKDTYDYRVAAEKPYVPRAQAPVDYFGPIFGAGQSVTQGVLASGIGKK